MGNIVVDLTDDDKKAAQKTEVAADVKPPNYYSMTMSELRNHCNRRGLGISGTKYNIIDRLKQYDNEQRRKRQQEEDEIAAAVETSMQQDDDGSSYTSSSAATASQMKSPTSSYGKSTLQRSPATGGGSGSPSKAGVKQTPAEQWGAAPTAVKSASPAEAAGEKRFVFCCIEISEVLQTTYMYC